VLWRAALSLALGTALLAGLPPGPSAAEIPGRGPVAEWRTTTGADGRVYIADSMGRALQFHGFNVKTGAPAADVTDQLLADAAARGLDHLRLGFFWQDLEPTQDHFDEAFVAQLVTVLDRAQRHGIVVILDMHQDVYGEAFDSRGIPAWATRTEGLPFEPQANWLLAYLQPAVQAAFDHLYDDADLRQQQIDAWLHVVEAVKGHPALWGYDLLNEPFGRQRPGEDLITAAARVEREQLTPMFQRLTDAISAADPDHWVFFEPPNLASLGVPTSLGEVRGPKVAIYPHMYDPAIEAATYSPDGTIQLDPTFFAKWADAITTYTDTYRIPMLVGEWGIAHPEVKGMDEFVARSLQTLDQVASGWSMFQMCRGSGYCPFDADGQAREAIGQIFQPYARAIAGAPVDTRWDPATRTLRVRFDDDESANGPTEIFLDAQGSYPDGWRVETSDLDGTWGQLTDASGVLAVTTPRTGARHAICVKPTTAPRGCSAGDVTPPPTTSPNTPTTRPPTVGPFERPVPARPIPGRPRFTG
jgi:endoglycosylceramidase